MKKTLLLYTVLLLILSLFLSDRLARGQTQWHFSEGAKMRLGKGTIKDIKFSPDGSRFAVATSIGIWMYDAHTGEEISLMALLPGEGREVTAIAFAPDGRILASGELRGLGRLWDVITGKPIVTFKEAPGPRSQYVSLRALVFSEDGTKLMGAISNMEIRTWDISANMKPPTILRQIKNQTTWRDGRLTLFSPNGRFLAITIEDWKNKNFPIQLWNATTGKLLYTLTGHTRWVKSIAFSVDSKLLISGDESETIRLWSTATGSLQSTLNWRSVTSTYALAFSSSGRFIASGHYGRHSDGVRLWDKTTGGKRQGGYAIGNYQHTRVLNEHKDYVHKLTFSPDEKILLTGSKDGTIQAWDTATGNPLFTCMGHLEGIRDVVFSQTGHTLISLSHPYNPTGIVQQRRWDVNTGHLLSTAFLKGLRVTQMVISPDGETVAAHSLGGKCLLWDFTTEPPLVISQFTLKGYPEAGLNVRLAFSLDSNKLAAGDANMLTIGRKDAFAHVWELTDSPQSSPTGSKKIRFRSTFKGHTDFIQALAFSPDGKTLATSSEDTTVRLWRVADGTSLFRLTAHNSRVNALAFSPDGKTLASAGAELYLWDTVTGTQLNTSHRGLSVPIAALVFSPDGSTVVAGNWDGILELWDVRTGGLLSTHTGHTRWLKVLKFSPDGKTLVSASWGDSTILLWDWEKLKKAGNR